MKAHVCGGAQPVRAQRGGWDGRQGSIARWPLAGRFVIRASLCPQLATTATKNVVAYPRSIPRCFWQVKGTRAARYQVQRGVRRSGGDERAHYAFSMLRPLKNKKRDRFAIAMRRALQGRKATKSHYQCGTLIFVHCTILSSFTQSPPPTQLDVTLISVEYHEGIRLRQ